MDPKTRRDELIAEWKQTQSQAQAHAQEAQRLAARATFLEGSIAVLNDLIGEPPVLPAEALPVPPSGKLNRAERRRLKGGLKVANG